MKIVHLCLANFYIDNFSYQENLLTKYHKELGYDVEIIASLESFGDDGEKTYLSKGSTYYNEHDIKVTRLNYLFDNKLVKKLKLYQGLFKVLDESKPDILFIHGCQFLDIKEILKFLEKTPNTKVYVDNHADFSNSATNLVSKYILHRLIWRKCAQKIEPYTNKFYGVLPARVKFLVDEYKIPNNKVYLLNMGVDDDVLQKTLEQKMGTIIREQYDLKDDDFLIVTGGKIDRAKKETLNLMEVINGLESDKVKLLIFGSVANDLKEQFNKCLGEKVHYVGWVTSEDVYSYFVAADLVAFPGRHSVFWEQVVGTGTPLLVKYWEGTTHIDLIGNVRYLKKGDSNEIFDEINKIVFDKVIYNKMLASANQQNSKDFFYKNIAKKSLN